MKHDTAKGMGESEFRQEQSQMESEMKKMNASTPNQGASLARPGDKMGVDGAVGGGAVMTGLEREMKRMMNKMMGGM